MEGWQGIGPQNTREVTQSSKRRMGWKRGHAELHPPHRFGWGQAWLSWTQGQPVQGACLQTLSSTTWDQEARGAANYANCCCQNKSLLTRDPTESRPHVNNGWSRFRGLTEKFRVITDKAICWKVCADDLLFCPEPAFSSPFPSGDTGLCGCDRWASPGSLRGQRTVCKCSKHNPCDLPWAGHTHSWNLQLLHSRCQASFDTSESGFRCLFYL